MKCNLPKLISKKQDELKSSINTYPMATMIATMGMFIFVFNKILDTYYK